MLNNLNRTGIGSQSRDSAAAKLMTALLVTVCWVVSGPVGAAEFQLTSTTFSEGDRMRREQLYTGLGCGGENISPQLSWQGAPEATRSFAVVMHDLDAPKEGGWWHWLVANIPANMSQLPEGAGDPKAGLIPEAVQSRTDFGNPGYGGACPPPGHGDHRYRFTVYALEAEQLPLDESSSIETVLFHINANKLAEAKLEVVYGR